MMKHIVSLSGGKDSTAMLLMMLDREMPIDYVVFVDTTKEFPQVYRHLDKLEKYITPLKITRLSFDYDYYFEKHVRVKGKRKGEMGYGFPGGRSRWCTALKRDTIRKFYRSLNDEAIEYIGIAYDEKKRIKDKPNTVYPLVEWGITEKLALEYCYSKGFDWEGLYEVIPRTSCYCCPFKSIKELRTIYKNFPDLWGKMRDMQSRAKNKFRVDYSIFDLEERFNGSYCKGGLL